MKVGGNARFFISVKNEAELLGAYNFAKERQLPIFVLGGGSNVVISDSGFDGLVIKNEIVGAEFEELSEKTRVKAGAGINWDELVALSVDKGLWGIENLSFIPGTVGAAPVQNIGAYGVEIKDTIRFVRALDIETGEFRHFTAEECDFAYRDSVFKKTRNFIITSVELSLSKSGTPNLSYKDLQKAVGEGNLNSDELTPEMVREMVISIRKKKLPDPEVIPTAGSFFKNPEVALERYEELLKKFPGMPGFNSGSVVKIPLAWIIENVTKLKGYKHGGAMVYERHALVLVNADNGRASDIYELAQLIHREVFHLTGIEIESEVQFVGSF